jgi:membrane-associated phospholipid phosphatase
MAATLLLVELGIVAIAPRVGITGLWFQFGILKLFSALILPMVWAKWRRLDRVSSAVTCAFWALLVVGVMSALTVVAARSPVPLQDALLARVDGLMMVSTPAVVRFVRSIPWLEATSHFIYAITFVLMIVALIAPALAGRKIDSERYVLSTTFSLIVMALLFACCPGIGPWTGPSGFPPAADQAAVSVSLRLLKSPVPYVLGPDIQPVVSFPSYHVIAAVLSAIALWGFRRIRWITAAFAAAVCVTTVTTGWHYAIDVIGGLAVVPVSQAMAVYWLSGPKAASAGA